MSIVEQDRPATNTRTAAFGAGGGEPYARALRQNTSDALVLHETGDADQSGGITMDFAKWNAEADATDLSLLRAVTGPVLDIGCGPGRMVRAALGLGLDALGLDVSPTAVEMARESGLPVIEGSVFEALPLEGRWQTALLVDGNIGIGGDVPAMLRRCREIVLPGGEIVVETHQDPTRDHTYIGTLVDSSGAESEVFPWAEVGLDRLIAMAHAERLRPTQSWVLDGRTFCRLVKSAA